jgi:hypothetical protein
LRPRLASLLEWSLDELESVLSGCAQSRTNGTVESSFQTAGSPLLTVEYFAASAEAALETARDLLVPTELTPDINARISQAAADYLTAPLAEVVPRIRVLLAESRALLGYRGSGAAADRTELLLATARCLGLLANAAMDAGAHGASHQHADAAASLASAAGHDPTVAWLRGLQASNAYWAGDVERSVRLAADAQALTRDSAASRYIAGLRARAAGRLGDLSRMKDALDAASRIADRPASELMTGVFGFSEAKQNLYVASGFLGAGGDARKGLAHARVAVALYASERARGFGDLAGARIDMTTAHLRLGAIDAANAAIGPVLALPAGKRVASVEARLGRLAREAQRIPSSRAHELVERIRDTLSQAPAS